MTFCRAVRAAVIGAILSAWSLSGVPAVAVAAARGDVVPKGLAASDWSSIRAAYQANRHAVFAIEGGYQARNPGQRWVTRFDGRAFLTTPDAGGWTWGLELVSYGREGAERPVAVPVRVEADGPRVSYSWSEALTEWYINDQRGLEHGYTVQQRPEETAGPLRFTLAVRGGLCPEVGHDGRGVGFIDSSGASVVNYSGLKVHDATGAAVPAWFELAGEELGLRVDDRAARYPLTIDPWAQQQAYLKASNTNMVDSFGTSVSVSGETVVVGAPYESSNATGVNGNQSDNSLSEPGAAYVFVRTGTSWTQQAYLKASNTGAGDHFGISVAVSGDTVVVGAPGESGADVGVNGNQDDNSASFAGAAYVFVRTGTVWTQQAYLKASNTGANDIFGSSVAASGDTVVVGAYREDSSATGVNGNQADNTGADSGAAYVFARTGTAWTQQAYLKASNTGANDAFGYSVAVSGDTVVVGAYREDSSATGVNGNQTDNGGADSGAAYVFVRTGTAWTQQAYLKASNTGASDSLGYSVAVSGDTVVVGAPNEDSSATGVNGNQADNSAGSAGAVYVFVRTGAIWSQQAYLKASNTGMVDVFGYSVAVSGDLLVVGAPYESSNATGVNGNQADSSAQYAGAAYVFTRAGGGTVWSQWAYLKSSNADANDEFGSSVSVYGETVVTGAHWEDSSATGVNGNQADNGAEYSGAAYVFLMDCDSSPFITQQPTGQSAVVGGSATFRVTATSNPFGTLAYQWRKNAVYLVDGGSMSGATSPTLTINPVSLSERGAVFDCIVSNSCGSTRSDPAGISVAIAPSGACCIGVTCTLASSANACVLAGGVYLGNSSVCHPQGRNGPLNACCPADINNSGVLSVQDIFDFLAAYFAGCP